MNRVPREFRPLAPARRDIIPVAFLGLIFIILTPIILAHPERGQLAMLTGLGALVGGGLWLLLRLRFPGSPRLIVGRQGMRYVRSGRERSLRWNEVAAIDVHHPRGEMRFVPVSGKRPIVMRYDMVATDGQAFVMLIEEYWAPPRRH